MYKDLFNNNVIAIIQYNIIIIIIMIIDEL